MQVRFSIILPAVAIVVSSACATTKASSSAKHEPLAVPPPPPRVIVPAPEPVQETVAPQPELVPALPRPARSSPREPARSEPKASGTTTDPAAAPQPAAAPPPNAGATGAPPQASELRTVETPDDSKASRLVRDTLDRAGRTLNGIDYARLPKPSQLQYDMAKRFIEQSEEALRTRNFTAAQLMAEKADTIAKELSGR
ncbi:MAG TPA: hypothetical protein VK886_22595 [Vicinamibacterales bacterium]|nr:hypothetical protein [Vicinamibacterales bacterium]